MGLANGYLYWVERPADADGNPDSVTERLRRVKKEGGAPETVAQLDGVEVARDCGIAAAGDELLFVLHGRETGDGGTDRTGGRSQQAWRGAGAAHRQSTRDVQSVGPRRSAGLGGRLGSLVRAARRDSGAKRLWTTKGKTNVRGIAVGDQSLIVFLSTGAATAPVGESMGLGSMGSRPPGGDQATGAQIVEVSPNGKATVVWQDAQPLRGGGVDGRNLLVCAKDGLLRLPGHGKPPVHIADTCAACISGATGSSTGRSDCSLANRWSRVRSPLPRASSRCTPRYLDSRVRSCRTTPPLTCA